MKILLSKKAKFFKLFFISIAVVLSIIIVACSNALKTFDMPGNNQDISYIVKGNSSQAIQYGNYIYFVNGYRGWEDENGNQNKDVSKGAVYRTELYGTKGEKGTTVFGVTKGHEFNISTKRQVNDWTQDYIDEYNKTATDEKRITDDDYELKASRHLDYDDKYEDVVDVNQLSNKTIGTSGYSTGGMWIFDDYLYYSTPSNERDKSGKVVYEKTEFYRVSLDGKKSDKIYKTSENSDSSPYAFYKQNGKVYLTVLDGTDIISVAMGKSGGKIENPVKLATDVTSAIMTTDSEYYDGFNVVSGKRKYTLNDYIVFTRDLNDDDKQTRGNIVEIMRADGSNRVEVFATGKTMELENVRDGLLFYKDTIDGQPVINYTNLSYAIDEPLYENVVKGTALSYASSEFDSFYNFRPNQMSDGAYVLASNSNGITFFDSSRNVNFMVFSGTATVLFVEENYIYFLDSESYVRRTRYDKSVDEKSETEKAELMSDQAVNTDSLQVTTVAGYVVYQGTVDEWADNYTMFKKIPSLNGESKEVFVGSKIDDDLKPDDDEDED